MTVTAERSASVRLHTANADETDSAGAALAAVLAPGTVVGLAGPLGAGKTCFARGMAARLGVDPTLIASPTFVYLVDYPGAGLVLHHAVKGMECQAGDMNGIAHRALSMAAATRSACTVSATS